MATHSSILAWEILQTEEPGGLMVHGITKWVGGDWVTKQQSNNFQLQKLWNIVHLFFAGQKKKKIKKNKVASFPGHTSCLLIPNKSNYQLLSTGQHIMHYTKHFMDSSYMLTTTPFKDRKVGVQRRLPRITSRTWYVWLEKPLIAQLVKNLLAMQETLVRFLGRKYPLEKG